MNNTDSAAGQNSAATDRVGVTIRTGGSTVLKNQFLQVDTDDVVFPDGRAGRYNKVTVGEGHGVVVVPVSRWRGITRVALVEQYRYPVGHTTFEFPRGGSVDDSFDEAARELAEETELVASTSRKLGVIHPDTGIMTNDIAVWMSTHDGDPVHSPYVEEETGARFRWYDLGEFDALVTSGRVTCGITLAAFALFSVRNLSLMD